jgi:hypothetical protein
MPLAKEIFDAIEEMGLGQSFLCSTPPTDSSDITLKTVGVV